MIIQNKPTNLTKPLVIYISGYKRSGKDTFAKMLIEELNKTELITSSIAFADTLKMIVLGIAGIDWWTLDKYKNNPPKIRISIMKFISKLLGIPYIPVDRSLLINLSKYSIKYLGEDIYVNPVKSFINEIDDDIVIVTDLRIEREYQIPGIRIWIDNKRTKSDGTYIESSLRIDNSHLIVNNNQNIENLYIEAKKIAEYIKSYLKEKTDD